MLTNIVYRRHKINETTDIILFSIHMILRAKGRVQLFFKQVEVNGTGQSFFSNFDQIVIEIS